MRLVENSDRNAIGRPASHHTPSHRKNMHGNTCVPFNRSLHCQAASCDCSSYINCPWLPTGAAPSRKKTTMRVSLWVPCRNRPNIGVKRRSRVVYIAQIALQELQLLPPPNPCARLCRRQVPTTMPAPSSQRRRWRHGAAAQGRARTHMMRAGRCAASCVSSSQVCAVLSGQRDRPDATLRRHSVWTHMLARKPSSFVAAAIIRASAGLQPRAGQNRGHAPSCAHLTTSVPPHPTPHISHPNHTPAQASCSSRACRCRPGWTTTPPT